MAPVFDPKDEKRPEKKQQSGGPTEDQMNMAGTVAQHSDNHGTKLEDEGGTGEVDSSGG